MIGPMFNNARGEASTLQMAPPFAFSDVTMTVFPLQANLARVTRFIGNYLNQADEIVRFEPFMPFVYLIILDYGKMSTQAARTGWVSQREVAFGVPLQWMVPGADGPRFHDWAFTTPFIFVDNELSLSTGREVYGWPKLLARLDPDISRWVNDPHGARKVFEIRSQAAADRPGDDLRAPFLTVTQTPVSGLTDLPMRLGSVTQALEDWPQAVAGMARLYRDVLGTFGNMLAGPATGGRAGDALLDPDRLRTLFSRDALSRLGSRETWRDGLGSVLGAMLPRLYSNTINLKQFRDAAVPDDTCYQAITAARMPIQRVGGGGLLGSENMMTGQINGGYNVHVTSTSAVPVVSALGLEPAAVRDIDGAEQVTLSPICPFWVKLDMLYGKGETLAWRSRQGRWHGAAGREGVVAPPPPPPKAAPRPAQSAAPDPVEELKAGFQDFFQVAPYPRSYLSGFESDDDLALDQRPNTRLIEPSNPFNTTRGASEALGGTFRMPDGEIRVLPLLADRDVLSRFVADYIQVPDHLRVELWGEHVYMIVCNFKRMTADLNPGASTSTREITFTVPVKCYDMSSADDPLDEDLRPDWLTDADKVSDWHEGADRLIGTALISPFSYVDNIRMAIAQSEVFGVPTLRSEISSPSHGWADKDENHDILAEAKAIVVPALNSNAEGTRHSLVQVRARPVLPNWDTANWRRLAAGWGQFLRADLDRKFDERDGKDTGRGNKRRRWFPFDAGRSLLLRILGGQGAINTLSLKQFRDASAPDQACYQGIVMRTLEFEKLKSVTEIERDLSVSIARFPTQPIGEILGLIPKRTIVTDHGIVDEFEPLRPFEIKADIKRTGGETLFERITGDAAWTPGHLPEGLLGWRTVEPGALAALVDERPCPKISYICHDPRDGTRLRYAPQALTAASLAQLEELMRTHVIEDLKVLRRRLKVELLYQRKLMQALDNGEIDDIGTFLRTMMQHPKEKMAKIETHTLAGALELISPATILDAALNRGWGRPPDPRGDRLPRSDFRLRAETFGPEISEVLFPAIECQDGYWPPSEDYKLHAVSRQSARILQLRFEFWGLMRHIDGDEAKRPAGGGAQAIADLAQSMMPEWFTPIESRVDRTIFEQVAFFDYWDMEKLDALEEALVRFFHQLEERRLMTSDLELWRKSWLRTLYLLKRDTDAADDLSGGYRNWPSGAAAMDVMRKRLSGLGVRDDRSDLV